MSIWSASDVVMSNFSQRTPESYVEAIQDFSLRSQNEYLLSGVHWERMVELLQRSESSNISIGSSTTSRQNKLLDPSFQVVTIIDLIQSETRDGKDIAVPREFITPEEYLKGKQIGSERSQLIFLRGYQSPDWLKTLGATLSIDPEFWRRHLAFLQLKDFYDLPPLPSSTYRNIQLRITTVFERHKKPERKAVENARLKATENLQNHHKSLGQANAPGASIVRRLDLHNEEHFTVEQHISCSIVSKNNGWAVLIWLDTGRPLPTKVTDSWIKGHVDGNEFTRCWPTIQHPPGVVLNQPKARVRSIKKSASLSGNTTNQYDITQSAALLPLQYGQDLDVTSMRLAPLYALSDVFRLAACSSNQYVSFLKQRIEVALKSVKAKEAMCLDDLRFSKDILDDYLDYLQEIIAFLEIGYTSWILSTSFNQGNPSAGTTSIHSSNNATTDQSMIDLTMRTREEFLKDFTCIQRRMQTLAKRCLEGTDIILNGAMLRESQKAIGQAEEVKQLAIIASIYAPLSFACSVCGMQYFTDNVVTGVAVFFGILVASFLLPYTFWVFISKFIAERDWKWQS